MSKYLFLLVAFTAFVFDSYGQANYKVGQQTLLLEDAARQRKLSTEIWYPMAAEKSDDNSSLSSTGRLKTIRDGQIIRKKMPLIMISHGFGGDRLSQEWLAAALARRGFFVAAVSHWGNTYDNLIPQRSVEFPERPKDVSFVLSKILENPDLKYSIDEKRIGALGFSIGGYTVLALAGAEMSYPVLIDYAKTPEGVKEFTIPEMPTVLETAASTSTVNYYKDNAMAVKDKRIRAIFAISPAIGGAFRDSRQMRRVDVPIYIIGTEGDEITPYKTNAEHYHKLIKKSDFYLIKGKAGHYVFLGEGNPEALKSFPVYYADDPAVSRRKIHEETIALVVKYFEQKLK